MKKILSLSLGALSTFLMIGGIVVLNGGDNRE